MVGFGLFMVFVNQKSTVAVLTSNGTIYEVVHVLANKLEIEFMWHQLPFLEMSYLLRSWSIWSP